MSTSLIQIADQLIPLAPARVRPRQSKSRKHSLARELRTWLRKWLPRLTSHHEAMEDLASGYDRLARRCTARKDESGAFHYRQCARAIREQIGIL